MSPLRDESVIAKLELAFEESKSGGVVWKAVPLDWVLKNLEGIDNRSIDALICEHIASRSEIDQVRETREEYRCLYDYHCDFRLSIESRRIYVETVLGEGRMGPVVTVVSVHYA